jgi:hypothetical protein
VLSGRLKGASFPAEHFLAWRAMEEAWDALSQRFWQYDLDGDGKVSHAEFELALAQLQHPALSSRAVVEALIAELDPARTGEVDFDAFSWRMACMALREGVAAHGAALLAAFRRRAASDACFAAHGGALPIRDAKDVFARALAGAGLRPVHIHIIACRARDPASPPGESVVSYACLAAVLQELLGDGPAREEGAALRAQFAEMAAAAAAVQPERWVERGDGARPPDGAPPLRTAPRMLAGVAVLKPGAMAAVGPGLMRRPHMHHLLLPGAAGAGGPHGGRVPASMRPSAPLREMQRYRERVVYGTEPWRRFWAIRSLFSSPELRGPAGVGVGAAAPLARGGGGGGGGGGGAPRAFQPRSRAAGAAGARPGGGTSAAGAAGMPLAEAVERLQRVLVDHFASSTEAFAALARAGEGAGGAGLRAADLRAGLEELDPELTPAALDEVVAACDASRAGVVLHSEFAQLLFPPRTDPSALQALQASARPRPSSSSAPALIACASAARMF